MSYINKEGLPVLVDKLLDPNNIKIGSNRLPAEIGRIATKAEEITKTVYEERDFSERVLEDGFTKDMVIKGETLQNLQPLCSVKYYARETFHLAKTHQANLFKPNTKYTAIFYNKPKEVVRAYISQARPTIAGLVDNIAVFNIGDSTSSGNTFLHFYVDSLEPSQDLIDKCLKIKCVLIEGDWTNKEIPPYFEGIQSVGQNNKINILSTNSMQIINNSDMESGAWDSNGGPVVNSNEIRTTSPFIKLPDNIDSSKEYYIIISDKNIKCNLNLHSYDSDKKYLAPQLVGAMSNGVAKIKFSQGNKYFSFRLISSNLNCKWYMSDKIEEYKPYVCDKKEILLPFEGGLKINDIVKDNKIIQSIETRVIGSEDVLSIHNDGKDYIRFRVHLPKCKNSNSPNAIEFGNVIACDKFALSSQIIGAGDKFELEFISTGTATNSDKDVGYISIAKNKLNTPDIEGFKEWVTNNKTTVYYFLKEPITHQIKPLDIRLYENGHISVDSLIQPSSAKYSAIMDKNAQIENAVEKTQDLDKRVSKLENFYDNKILENSHKLELLRLDIEGSGI